MENVRELLDLFSAKFLILCCGLMPFNVFFYAMSFSLKKLARNVPKFLIKCGFDEKSLGQKQAFIRLVCNVKNHSQNDAKGQLG